MRIYKRRPFSLPNSVKVNAQMAVCERLEKTYEDLQRIRKHIAEGTMTEALYDFLNMDGSMERLFPGLPRPIDNVAFEELKDQQLLDVDSAIEQLKADWKTIMAGMWAAIKEWILDWFDINRVVRFDIERLNAAYRANPSLFGDYTSFEQLTIRCYHKPDWNAMVASCDVINKILATLPQNNLSVWVANNKVNIQNNLKEFGQSVVEPGPRIVEGNPVHDRVATTLGAARWNFNLLGSDMDACIKILADEIAYRKLFNSLEHLFTTSTIEDRVSLHFVRKLVMLSKANTFVVARSLRAILRAVKDRKQS